MVPRQGLICPPLLDVGQREGWWNRIRTLKENILGKDRALRRLGNVQERKRKLR